MGRERRGSNPEKERKKTARKGKGNLEENLTNLGRRPRKRKTPKEASKQRKSPSIMAGVLSQKLLLLRERGRRSKKDLPLQKLKQEISIKNWKRERGKLAMKRGRIREAASEKLPKYTSHGVRKETMYVGSSIRSRPIFMQEVSRRGV